MPGTLLTSLPYLLRAAVLSLPCILRAPVLKLPYLLRGSVLSLPYLLCAVLSWRMVLCAYAMRGTELACGAMRLCDARRSGAPVPCLSYEKSFVLAFASGVRGVGGDGRVWARVHELERDVLQVYPDGRKFKPIRAK
eukprot:1239543-Rhodomonas_salina.1